ncbi:enoyl-CoA hydratase [Streptococcus pneumoniae]|uniref:enoyl-CoA hydratase family protein n=2 Tax=Stutzerimonas stutzeri TaxID=316 RepID=UPI0005DDB55C|nr:enoyl-CoA hydratase family protein [Stutzerimonas stutzeri]CJL66322.1 enoyl-CoA hydratase [Streptococcus pneumoniae]HAJ85887.1 enoyl-CoA hydratase family protein [Pseudomonas sp.]MCQ4226019.1 enoyl-CoA hydratase family protein [Stutzerimonas stutzeri]MDH0444498.1 enoyl-CoA hydratase family protein [Stutzerimonas stutzeri]RRV82497.1 enoyl-CoA hydratase family protein [Stutzerimonas stutzeri]
MSTAFITSLDNGVAELVINKPPVNALDSHEWQALADTINALGADLQTRVIVIRAEGRGFCAGVDIKELDQHPELIVKVNRGNYETFKAVHRCPVPVIVAVHGFVLGGGIGITGAADIVVASECATFALPEVDRGAMGGGAHLQRLFPVQKVRYLFFTGEKIGAREAERYGFIERVVPREQLREATLEIADKIAAKSAAMIRIAKEALNGIEDGNLEDKYRWEQGFTLQAYNEADSAETRRAFVEKRDAKF